MLDTGQTIQSFDAPGPHGPVPIRLYSPQHSTGTALLWIHGGAFMMGDLDVPEAHWVSTLLADAGITVASVDYRLANDGVHFPVPSDDVLAGWRWAIENRDDLTWHIGGGSAGGNLAASVTLQLRDVDDIAVPASAILIYPVLHHEIPEPSSSLRSKLDRVPEEFRFTPSRTTELNLNYVGVPDLLGHPYAFPAAAAELEGLPPTLIVNSEIDYLRPSGEAYGAALALAGVDVTVVSEPGALHGHLNDVDSGSAVLTVGRMIRWLLRRTD